jgi:hypothetical protein
MPYFYRVEKWAYDMEKDLLCWVKFLQDKLVNVIAIEFAAKHSEWGVTTTIDLVADIRFNRKVVRAIVDLKSGKKGFFPGHEFQLEVGKLCWNNTFPNHQVTHIFNFAPHDFNVKKVAGGTEVSKYYKFENQTGKTFGMPCGKDSTVVEHYLEIAKATRLHRPKRDFYGVHVEVGDLKDFDITKAINNFNF